MFRELWIQSMRETPWFSSPVLGMESVILPQGSADCGTSFSTFNACWLKRMVGTLEPVKVVPLTGSLIVFTLPLLWQAAENMVLKSPVSAAAVGTMTWLGDCIWKLRVPW